MELFVRFTEDIEGDIERGTSILTNHDDEVAEGLCAFGPFKNREDALESVKKWQEWFPGENEHYALIEAEKVHFCKKGSLGTIIRNIKVIEKY